ncbi:MAG: GxxExxY protein [Candidatus Pacebacteria bacterium]|jgi:GxxExxY protein|nr:GxxExxY protein [Candidatus Paceibacterota bacterium]MDP7368072.1 GxxExxY protein [Candidatus Paceibacterota bacterium]MDP7466006.1 GxxExxY protein [Candidatus Paceibacterota bacterium]MDP7648274.1 GxxExxY protein [Candidatus Paceibacterota bacterium]|tara:strand:- start:27260 stop:27643 length:384 start_codon:yes stop_codon:yes gene_type:complete
MKNNIKKIENIAKDVYKKLGSGHQEVVYDKAMQVGLRLAKIRYDSQKVVELIYKDHYVGEGFPDLIIFFGKTKIVVELKAVGAKLGVSEEQQIKNYMKLLKIKDGLLINFQQPKKEGRSEIEIKEIV